MLGAVALLLALLGWQWGRAEHAGRKAETAGRRADVAEEAAQAAWDAHRREAEARTEESRRTKRLQENQDAEFRARQAAQRDAVASRAAADGLREQARLVARASRPASCAAAAPGSSPADDGPDLLADVLGELAARADGMAVAADSARIAGQLCERAYDALTER
ncbi:MAG: DUF2514 family protein [Rubrivivax sp.]|nr:MAG: DUF2514 family protein [Rubrivivax sp.]